MLSYRKPGFTGEILGLGGFQEEMICKRTLETPRTCIIIQRGINILFLIKISSKNFMVVKLKTISLEGPEEIIIVRTNNNQCDGRVCEDLLNRRITAQNCSYRQWTQPDLDEHGHQPTI